MRTCGQSIERAGVRVGRKRRRVERRVRGLGGRRMLGWVGEGFVGSSGGDGRGWLDRWRRDRFT